MNTFYAIVPLGYQPAGPFRDQLARLAHRLLLLTSITTERRERGHYIPMYDDTWRSLFGGKSSEVKKAAIASGLIERNGRYSVGNFPQSYRLARQYRSGRFNAIELTRKPRMKKRLLCDRDRLGEVGRRLTDRFSDFSLPSTLSPSNPWDCFALNRLLAKDFYSMRCDFGRFHSNFTSIPKLFRSSLTLNSGDTLASIDIRNVQPLLLGLVTRRHTQHRRNQHIPICHTLNEYLRLCEAGQIYEFCLDCFRNAEVDPYWIPHPSRKGFVCDPARWDRQKVKQAFVICLFDRVEATKSNPIFRILNKHFPEIAEYIIQSKNHKYQTLARNCQQMESQLMIDGVAASFMARHPDSPILTIHDEIIVPESLVDSLTNIITNRFQLAGVTPSLKIEQAKPDKSGFTNPERIER
ncbi:MAG: hypothetical protein ACK5OC_13955 [Pirellula sp.]